MAESKIPLNLTRLDQNYGYHRSVNHILNDIRVVAMVKASTCHQTGKEIRDSWSLLEVRRLPRVFGDLARIIRCFESSRPWG